MEFQFYASGPNVPDVATLRVDDFSPPDYDVLHKSNERNASALAKWLYYHFTAATLRVLVRVLAEELEKQ